MSENILATCFEVDTEGKASIKTTKTTVSYMTADELGHNIVMKTNEIAEVEKKLVGLNTDLKELMDLQAQLPEK